MCGYVCECVCVCVCVCMRGALRERVEGFLISALVNLSLQSVRQRRVSRASLTVSALLFYPSIQLLMFHCVYTSETVRCNIALPIYLSYILYICPYSYRHFCHQRVAIAFCYRRYISLHLSRWTCSIITKSDFAVIYRLSFLIFLSLPFSRLDVYFMCNNLFRNRHLNRSFEVAP